MRSVGGAWLDDAIRRLSLDVTPLPEPEADEVVRRLAEAFVDRPASTFWWDALRSDPVVISYHRDPEPFLAMASILERLACEPDQSVVVLAGIDDRDGNSAAVDGFRGRVKAIVRALGDCPGFEFVIVDEAMTWAIFDTHHDAVVVAGTPPGKDHLEALVAEFSVSS